MIHEKIFVFCCALGMVWSVGASDSALELWGEYTQGSLLVGRVSPGSSAELDPGAAVVTAGGWLLVGLDREQPVRSTLVVADSSGTRTTTAVLELSKRDYRVQRINGLPQAQVTPDAESLQRIRREQATVAKARSLRRESQDFLSGFRMPLRGRLTGVYGSQRILNGEPRQPHYGVDIAAPVGTPVVAPAAGTVTLAEPDLYFSGGTLIVDHGYGLSSSFLHLSEILVEVGDRVEPGDAVARVGATGRVTGPHLDWRMNLGETRVDPLLVLKALPAED